MLAETSDEGGEGATTAILAQVSTEDKLYGNAPLVGPQKCN